MQEKLQKEFVALNANGASKKRWYVYYRKLCMCFNISRSIQLGLRGVDLEQIIAACSNLLESGQSIYVAPSCNSEEKKEEKISCTTTTNRKHSVNINTIASPNGKVMVNFSVLIDLETFGEIIKLINVNEPHE